MPRSDSVTGHGSPPALASSQICEDPASGLGFGNAWLLRYAIVSPVGDHRGFEISSVPRVSCSAFPSLKLERYKLLTRTSLSLSAVLFTHKTNFPSAEIRNCPASS